LEAILAEGGTVEYSKNAVNSHCFCSTQKFTLADTELQLVEKLASQTTMASAEAEYNDFLVCPCMAYGRFHPGFALCFETF
jgi:hypothetical protein